MSFLFVLPEWHTSPRTRAQEHAVWLAGELALTYSVEIVTLNNRADQSDAQSGTAVRVGRREELAVHRFPAMNESNSLLDAAAPSLHGNITPGQFDGLRLSWPRSVELLRFLEARSSRFDAILFYSAPNAVSLGLPLLAGKAILVPALSRGDEIDSYAPLFEFARAIVYISQVEREMIAARVQIAKPWAVMSIVPTVKRDADPEFLQELGALPRPVVLYPGVVSLDTDCDELFAEWAALCDRPRTRRRTLLLTGDLEMRVPGRPDIVAIRAESDAARHAAIAAADLVLDPARSSRSDLLVLEAWSAAKPVLVHRLNAMGSAMALKVSGGMSYWSTETFVHAVNRLVEEGATFAMAGHEWWSKQAELEDDLGAQLLQLIAPESEDLACGKNG